MYASNGAWAALFRRSAGFHSTQLMREREGDRYLCIDRWETMQAFEDFKQKFAREYQELDRAGEELTEEELRLGIFEEL